MKNIIKLLSVFACVFFSACNVPQIKRDGVSFEGLKTFYVELPRNGAGVFGNSGMLDSRNAALSEAIAQNLEAKGYVRAAEKSAADIVFVPVWSASIADAEMNASVPVSRMGSNLFSDINFIGSRADNSYATLEVQAFVKGDPRWGWRGFSPIKTDVQNITSAMIKDQATWALEFFPPEKYPNPRKPFLELFEASNVTPAEIERKNAELAAEQQKRKEAAAQAEAAAKARAKKQAAAKAQPKPAQPAAQTASQAPAQTASQPAAQPAQPQTIEELNALFKKHFDANVKAKNSKK